MKFREGTSKAGKPYAGNFCSNKECDNVVWEEAKPQPDRHEEIMNGIRMIWKKIDDLGIKIDELSERVSNIESTTMPPEEHLKEGELEIPIYDEEQ